MGSLTADDRVVLFAVLDMRWAGGLAPTTYPEWRRFEKLRKARLLRYWKRRSVRWDHTFYDVTDAGVTALATGRETVVLQ